MVIFHCYVSSPEGIHPFWYTSGGRFGVSVTVLTQATDLQDLLLHQIGARLGPNETKVKTIS